MADILLRRFRQLRQRDNDCVETQVQQDVIEQEEGLVRTEPANLLQDCVYFLVDYFLVGQRRRSWLSLRS